MNQTFFLRKMTHSLDARGALSYKLGEVNISDFIGKQVEIEFQNKIECVNCGRSIKKTFNQGYCFPCFQTLAACDSCILRPEKCHYRAGTCREPEWAQGHCLIKHVVYLANTTDLKIGITREGQQLTRWGDQGALEAIYLAVVPERYYAGLMEEDLKGEVKDKTDWRALIKGSFKELDLREERERVRKLISEPFQQYLVSGGEYDKTYTFKYPVNSYLEKAKTHNFDKDPLVSGELTGIHGQYLFIAEKALNIRKFGGYQVSVVTD